MINPDEYIEKTISVSFDLPRLSPHDFEELVGQTRLPVTLDGEHLALIRSGLGGNSRRIKRFLNTLAPPVPPGRGRPGSRPRRTVVAQPQAEPRDLDPFLKFLSSPTITRRSPPGRESTNPG